MDVFQNLITLDIQVAAIIVANIISGFSLSEMCKNYTYLSYYLTFLQTMFMIKVNTSMNPFEVWWFNWFWCIVLYSFILSILVGLLEFIIQPTFNIERKLITDCLKVLYFSIFVLTSVVVLVICDPNKC